MDKHEVEALRGLMAFWGKRNNPNFDICVKELEALLISLPAPEDGLREGLEGLVKDLYELSEVNASRGACNYASGMSFVLGHIKKLLAKTPDPWKPIEDIPSDFPCPKCGSKDVLRHFREKGEVWKEHGTGKCQQSKHISHGAHESRAKKDCITHHCRCCQFEWDTDPLPAPLREVQS